MLKSTAKSSNRVFQEITGGASVRPSFLVLYSSLYSYRRAFNLRELLFILLSISISNSAIASRHILPFSFINSLLLRLKAMVEICSRLYPALSISRATANRSVLLDTVKVLFSLVAAFIVLFPFS